MLPGIFCKPAYCAHRYSSSQAWNADQSLLANGCWWSVEWQVWIQACDVILGLRERPVVGPANALRAIRAPPALTQRAPAAAFGAGARPGPNIFVRTMTDSLPALCGSLR